MSYREHVLAALNGEPVDRVPWLPEINAVFAEQQVEARGLDAGELGAPVAIALEMGAASFLAGPFVREETAPDVHVETREQGDEIVETIATPRGRLRACRRWDPDAATYFQTDFFIQGPEDYEAFNYYYTTRRFSTDESAFREAVEPALEHGIVALPAPPTPYMDCIMNYAGIENTMFQLFDHPRRFRDLLEAMHQKNLEQFGLLLQAPVVDIIRPFEDTSSKLCAPDTFERLCAPCLQDYAELAHGAGARFVPHMCGHLKDMLPRLKNVDIDGIEAVTPPPTGDCTARMVRDALGSDTIIIGGFDATNFARESPQSFRTAMLEALRPMRDEPRFIFGHEEISPAARWENVDMAGKVLAQSSGA